MACPVGSWSGRLARRAAASGVLAALMTVGGPSTLVGASAVESTTTVPEVTTVSEVTTVPEPSSTTVAPQNESQPTDPGSDAGSDPNPDSSPDSNPDGDAGSNDPDGSTEGEPDPLSDEGKSEDAPGVDPEIPPPTTYGGQDPYRPPEILWSSVAEAERRLERSQQIRRDAVAEVKALRLRAKHLGREEAALDDLARQAIDEVNLAVERYQGRAVADYRLFASGVAPSPAMVVDPSALARAMEERRGSHLAEAALAVGQDDLDDLSKLRLGLDVEARILLDRLDLVAEYQVDAELAVTAAAEEVDQATIEYEAFRAGSEIYISGVLFPIAGPYETPLIDSFGFPRMTGTDDEHWHEGIDIFAPRGTPLVAAERGIVTRVGVGRLGGLKLWLVGESGSEWYYAHLDSFAPGLRDGQLVEAGELLGHVGNTGNAVGTPPHLHLQLHPDGGRPIDPYPLLKIVSDLDHQQVNGG